jgi:acyl-CoA synthetase (AMP-forming)/AMP-acid ligase II
MTNLFERVARYAERASAKIAVSRWRPGSTSFVQTSYGELLRKAETLAALLAELTAEQSMVPMLVGKSADGIAAMLGAVATRRPFSFLNTRCRGPQVAAILEATGARACVIDTLGLIALKGSWKEHPQIAKTTWLLVEHHPRLGLYAEAAEALRRVAPVIPLWDKNQPADSGVVRRYSPAPDRIGTCLFTSGSTGKPKGVLVSEADLIHRLEAEILWFRLHEEDVLLSILPFSFDVGLNQLLTALAVGAELVLLDSWLPADVLAATEQRKVTGISAVPSIWQGLLNSGARFDKGGRHASLRYIAISGGSLPRRHLQELAEIAKGVGIFKTYGQTEAFRATSLRPEEYEAKLDSVGKPFPGVRVYVVREDRTRCDAGEIGEVVHTGLGMMMGYLGDTDCDAELKSKLQRNPFYGNDDPSPLAVFTGDMGYLDDRGYLFLKGRRDGMLKVMGNRVYPQEVMNQIVSLPGVREAVVGGVTGTDGLTTVVAHLVVSDGATVLPGTIRKLLSARLPAFMIPKEIVFVDHIPRTLNGKADERRLMEEYAARVPAAKREGATATL